MANYVKADLLNIQEGELILLINEAIERIASDVAKRPFEKRKRSAVLKIHMTPDDKHLNYVRIEAETSISFPSNTGASAFGVIHGETVKVNLDELKQTDLDFITPDDVKVTINKEKKGDDGNR